VCALHVLFLTLVCLSVCFGRTQRDAAALAVQKNARCHCISSCTLSLRWRHHHCQHEPLSPCYSTSRLHQMQPPPSPPTNIFFIITPQPHADTTTTANITPTARAPRADTPATTTTTITINHSCLSSGTTHRKTAKPREGKGGSLKRNWLAGRRSNSYEAAVGRFLLASPTDSIDSTAAADYASPERSASGSASTGSSHAISSAVLFDPDALVVERRIASSTL
jgi:hypothetical protein